ncbi:MAG: hypothetical protein ACXV4A_10710 [Actinomycetes bacterium]
MLYALRTTFRLPSGDPEADGMGRSDRLLEWLDTSLPTRATLGGDVAARQWLGNRYTEPEVVFELVTHYRNVFAATADRLRIAQVVAELPPEFQPPAGVDVTVDYSVMRVYGEAEMLNIADPTKKTTHPC